MFIVMRRKFNKYDPATIRLFKKGGFRKVDYEDRVQALGSLLQSRLKSFRTGLLLTKPIVKWTNVEREFVVNEHIPYTSIKMYSDTGDAGGLLGPTSRLNQYLNESGNGVPHEYMRKRIGIPHGFCIHSTDAQ
jgi:hypothetical protein